MRALLACLLLLSTCSVAGAEEIVSDDAALLQGYLPKEDLGVLDFLVSYPDADGRGVRVAILDTGVDLAHPALQRCTTGEPKIIDLFDATDNGYLELPVLVTGAAAPPFGLSGRPLTLPSDLPVDGVVRLGILVGRQFFPPGLVARRSQERRKVWIENREAFEASTAGRTDPRSRAVREEYERIIEKDDDPGDLYDVVAVRQPNGWRVRIDTDADGDLEEEAALDVYRESRQVVLLPEPVHLSVAVERIARDGSSIVLFFDEGGHGTHVAGIVAGFYEQDDPLNGLAPGVQLLAAKIGNGRFGGSTSHNSIMKAAQWAVDHGADVINLSFGGRSFFDDGREVTSAFLDELVEKTGVVICASAGNAGPALSTVGSPGSARRVLAWGAAISKKTQQTNYGTLDPRRDDLFHFTSRGPLLNGDPGVDFISPGAALSPLPTWGLVNSESWNGTSMASPQGAGLCALLLSACRQQGIPLTVARLRRAMGIGARQLPGISVIEQGQGIPQAIPTLLALKQLSEAYPSRLSEGRTPHDLDATDPVVQWVVATQNATGSGGGYYNRDLRRRHSFRVDFHVHPDFPADSLQATRARFQRIVSLRSEVPWMRPPPQISLHSRGGAISVEIDPEKLEPGLNVGRVLAHDVARPGAGVEFALVATIILPRTVDPIDPILEGSWDLESGDRRSIFVRVPDGASLARLRLVETTADPSNAYQVALSEPDLVRPVGDRNVTRRFDLAVGEEAQLESRVASGGVLECAVFSRWRDNHPGLLQYRLEFLGVDADEERPVRVESGRPGAGFVLGAPPWGADLHLSASLDSEEEPLEIEWRAEVDTLFDGRLNGVPPILQQGHAYLRAGKDEEIRIDLRTGPEFEDLLDDSFVRVFDNEGREVFGQYLSDGFVTLRLPHEAVYQLVFSIWLRGSQYVGEETVVSPVILRHREVHEVDIHRSPVEGFKGDRSAVTQVNLVADETRRLFVRAEDLPEDRHLRGTIEVSDAHGNRLARIPLRADTDRWIAPEAPELLSQTVDVVLHRARVLAGRSDVEEAAREKILSELSLCERLRGVSPQPAGDEDDPDEEEAPPPSEVFDLEEAYARLLRNANAPERLSKAIEALSRTLPVVEEDSPASAKERRRKEAIVEALRAELEIVEGNPERAREHLNRARSLDSNVEGGTRSDAILRLHEGQYLDAHERALAWLEDHPDDGEIEELLVRSLLELGWFDLMKLHLSEWPRRRPGAAERLLSHWAELGQARGFSPDSSEALPSFRP